MAGKLCQRCGSTFTARGAGKHKWCEPCKVRVCPFCNEEFRVTPQQDKQRFCSHKCRSDESASRSDEKFWAKVEKTDDCWLWAGSTNYAGYGVFYPQKNRSILAHRRAYAQTYGKLPDDTCVLHRCDTPNCVNPSHLFTGTREDNIRDMISKKRNRHPSGEWHPHSKLTEEGVRAIRRAYENGTSITVLAKQYGVDKTNISKIVLRKTWRHVD